MRLWALNSELWILDSELRGAGRRGAAALIIRLQWRAESDTLPPVKRIAITLLAAVLCALFAMWWFSDKQIVKRRTQALLDTVSIEEGCPKIARGLQAASLDGFLAPNITLDVPDSEASGNMSRDMVSGGFRYVAERANTTDFAIDRVESITLDDDSAVVTAVIDAKAVVGGRTRIDGAYRTEFSWRKLDGNWRIAGVAMTPAEQ